MKLGLTCYGWHESREEKITRVRGFVVDWEGSTTVVYIVVWQNFVNLWTWVNTVLWLAKKNPQPGNLDWEQKIDQSQRRFYPCTSNHGISLNDSVNYSGWPLPVDVVPGCHRSATLSALFKARFIRNFQFQWISDTEVMIYRVLG